MTIQDRNLPLGTRLVANYKKVRYVCTVGVGEEGKLAFIVDGQRYTSPSAAGSAVMSGQACNGWRFWTVDGEATTADVAADSGETAPKAERKPRAARSPRKFKLIKRMEEQPSDLEEGQVAWWCAACQRSFIAGAETPEACAEGHRADDPELTSAPSPEAVAAEAVESEPEPGGEKGAPPE